MRQLRRLERKFRKSEKLRGGALSRQLCQQAICLGESTLLVAKLFDIVSSKTLALQ